MDLIIYVSIIVVIVIAVIIFGFVGLASRWRKKAKQGQALVRDQVCCAPPQGWSGTFSGNEQQARGLCAYASMFPRRTDSCRRGDWSTAGLSSAALGMCRGPLIGSESSSENQKISFQIFGLYRFLNKLIESRSGGAVNWRGCFEMEWKI